MTRMKDTFGPEEVQASQLDDETFLQGIVQDYCQDFLHREITAFLQATPYARTDNRIGYRNGYKPRLLKTRVGKIELLMPQDREGQFHTELFNRYQRNEKALVLALQESYLQGVSTRNVKEITEKLCGTSFSKSLVSSLCQDLDQQINAWRTRPLTKAYPYVTIDAHYEYVRDDRKVMSKAVLIVKGIDEDGYRELLAVDMAYTECEVTWSELFKTLKARGLRGVLCVTSDEHKGLVAGLRRHFQGVCWQRCQTHFQRNVKSLVPRTHQAALAEGVREVFDAPDLTEARSRLDALINTYQDRRPDLAQKLDLEMEHTLTCFHFPVPHRKRIRTTNGLERFHEEVNRRSRVVRIFPNDAACIRLVGALAMEQSEEWLTGRRYLDMTLLETFTPPATLASAAD